MEDKEKREGEIRGGEEFMSVQSFNFAHKVLQNEDFSAPNFAVLDFRTTRKFFATIFRQFKIWREGEGV